MANYKFDTTVPNFLAFKHQIIGRVHANKPCYSVSNSRKRKYDYKMVGNDIIANGDMGQKISLLTPKKLRDVYDRICDQGIFNTSGTASALGRNFSPLLALMLESKVVVKI